MKKAFIAASLLIMAVSCTSPQGASESNAASTEKAASSTAGDMVYVNIDQIIAESDMFNEEGLPLQKRTETAQRGWSQTEQKLQSDAAKLQKKFQDGLITSANAQKEQASIESRAQAFQTSTQKQMAELDEENRVFANRTQDIVIKAIRNINKDYKYKMIVNASALVDADSTLNISNIVLEEVNKLYKEEK